MKGIIIKVFLTVQLIACFVYIANTQNWTNDATFNSNDDCSYGEGQGFDLQVYASVHQGGKTILGGLFNSYDGTLINRIARINLNGSLDATFNPGTGFNDRVSTISIQNDGKIIVGGYFTSFNGVVRNKIARLNPDGSLDTTFNPGTGFDALVFATCVQTDGKIIVGGNFSTYNSIAMNEIVRLNTDGTIDSTFNIGFGFGGGSVDCISIQTNGKIIVGGGFSRYNNINRNKIVRLNTGGSIDTSFNIGSGFSDRIKTSSIQADGKIILGGDPGRYNGIVYGMIIRLNQNGSRDTTFNNTTLYSTFIQTTSIQSDGKIIIGGSFNYPNASRLARLNTDGSLDSTFNQGTGLNQVVFTTCLQADGKIIAGGAFTSYNGLTRNRIVRLNIDGSPDLFGFNSEVSSIAIQTDGKIIVGGSFTTFYGTSLNRIARLNTDGSLDTSFNIGSGFDNSVNSISIQNNGKIIIGGTFGSFNGTARGGITRLNTDGSLDLSFNPGTGFSGGGINTTILQSDGKIIAGGSFSGFNGITRTYIARLNIDGTLDVSFNPGTGFNSIVYTAALQTNGKILFGGVFNSFNGITRSRIARLNTDGSLDISFNPVLNLGNYIKSISVQPNGKIIASGGFIFFCTPCGPHILRYNTDGTVDSTFNYGAGSNGHILSTSLQPDGKIIVGGVFTTYNGVARNKIARINPDGTLDNTFNLPIGFDGTVNTTALQIDGRIIVGGAFTTIEDICRSRIARLRVCFNSTATQVISACGSFTWINGITYTTNNTTATYIIRNAIGCDSTITLNLTIRQPTSSMITQSACSSYTLNGQTYTSTGTYTQLRTNAAGCDSTITLNLTIRQPSSSTQTQSACSSYTLNGQTYTSTGTYTQLRTNAAGCDSTITLNLTIRQPSSSTQIQSACSSYTLNGQTYTSTGTYTQLRTNAAGCDSTITLNLTIRQTSSSTLTQSACNSYTLNGQTYTATGTYTQTLTNALGCDSIITLNLTLNQSSSVLTQTSCNSYTLNGQTYTASGSYTQVRTNVAGCDSTITLNLTISQPSSSTLTQTGCSSYTLNGQTYNASGSYTQVRTNVAGCDSTITLNLIINQNPTASATSTPVSVIGATDGSINLSVSGGSAPYAYSWSNGSSNEDLNGLLAGTYTVTITDANNCSFVLSETVSNPPLSINMEGNSITADLFPNPADTKVSLYVNLNAVSNEVILNIYNPLGIKIASKSYQNSKEISDEIDIAEFPVGMYIFEINTSGQKIIKKLVKK
jgi:uncharacterized delta-60 repeat protein